MKFIPEATEVISTNEVKNTFKRPVKEIKEGLWIVTTEDDDHMIKEGEDEDKSQSDEPEEQEEIFKDPSPLFVLDLVLKPGDPLPKYSTEPDEIVKTILHIFDDGIKTLQEIPQLEPILLKHLFRTHSK